MEILSPEFNLDMLSSEIEFKSPLSTMRSKTNTWPDGLQQETRNAISEVRNNPDGKLHFKNRQKGGAYMTFQELLSGKLSLADSESGEVSEFADTEELLTAGWTVD